MAIRVFLVLCGLAIIAMTRSLGALVALPLGFGLIACGISGPSIVNRLKGRSSFKGRIEDAKQGYRSALSAWGNFKLDTEKLKTS